MSFKYAVPAFFILFFACKDEPRKANTVTEKPVLTSTSFTTSEGNCEKSCAEFSARYPLVTTGTPALRDSVMTWVDNKVRDYSIMSEMPPTQRVTVENAGKEFLRLWKADDAGFSYNFEMKDTILALTDKFVTLRLDFYIFTGGAHPNYFSEFAVFDATSGKVIPKSLFIKDEKAVLPLLDTAFKAEKQEAFDNGYTYEGGQIPFPTQCAFTEKGVVFHYNTYEIGPYAMGDADIFLTWVDLGASAAYPFLQTQTPE